MFPDAATRTSGFCGRISSSTEPLRTRRDTKERSRVRQTTDIMPLTFYSKPGLVAYVTCGDPDLATTREIVLAAIEGGASVIELGVPFSDPVADGPVIQRASERALKQGTSLAQVLTLAAEIRVEARDTA